MSETNWKELAVILASNIRNYPGLEESDRVVADRILKLAQPDEKPLPWPGCDRPAEVSRHAPYFINSNHGVDGKSWIGPDFDTPAEAIAEWNRVVRAMRGVMDKSTRGLLDAISRCPTCKHCAKACRSHLDNYPENPTQE